LQTENIFHAPAPAGAFFFYTKSFGFRFPFALFFVQKKSAAKEVKKRAVLSLCQFVGEPKLLAPPRVEILFVPHKIYSEPRRIFAICRPQ
jgi:hypothetical protein